MAQKPKKEFYVSWIVKNTGTKTWSNNGIDFVFDGGYHTEQRPIQDLPRSVVPGKSIELKVLLIAPERPDTYNVIWSLRVGQTKFCHMKIVFTVK
jgi:hypothetical protein